MSADAIVMMIFGLGITWGGAAVCMYIALRKKDNQD
ncbi:MAG: methionine/alanine import family NSS transporter small subunit [Spirochaetales bacterium]|nr:methionine/alanine import family NSS transporter small subunit [Spirochaetales bacterium]